MDAFLLSSCNFGTLNLTADGKIPQLNKRVEFDFNPKNTTVLKPLQSFKILASTVTCK